MAEIADDLLPVFPFRINWKYGVAERLEWKTDVLADLLGNEQRRSLRLTPRREFEATLSLWEQDRQFWDLWLHRMVGTEFLFPVWQDSVRAAQEAAQGQSLISVDTRGLEFRTGSYGLLRGLTALSWERFRIAEVHDDRLVVDGELEATWPQGTRVEPLIRGRLSDQSEAKAITSRVSETQVRIEATHAQPFEVGPDTWEQYEGRPVLVLPPDRSQDVSHAYEWAFKESDSGTGRRYRTSETQRATVRQKHGWFLRGRAAKAAFRQLCYRLRGAATALWVPTFNEDLTLSRDRPAGTDSIFVKAVGWAYTGGATSGRDRICIQRRDGTRAYRRIIGTAAAPAGEERLMLDAPLSAGLTMAEVSRISYMDTARLENDRVEFTHINAADGMTTVSSVFRTFRDEREAPDILSYPIPYAGVFVTPWRYLVIPDSDPTLYNDPDFDDSQWPFGESPFGNKTDDNWPPAKTPVGPLQTLWCRCYVPAGVPSVVVSCDDTIEVWYNGVDISDGVRGLGDHGFDLLQEPGVLAVRVVDTKGTYIGFMDNLLHRAIP